MSYFHLEALKRFLTVKETAFVLNVSVDTVYKLIQTKALVAKKISPRKTNISSEELQRYINSK
mgnify:FL=1|jgi:excisionase family DNA binding protein